MELTLDCASEKCPYCGAVSLFPCFSRRFAFVCKECGKGVSRQCRVGRYLSKAGDHICTPIPAPSRVRGAGGCECNGHFSGDAIRATLKGFLAD